MDTVFEFAGLIQLISYVPVQTYELPGTVKLNKTEERTLDDVGFAFVQKCIEVLESRGKSFTNIAQLQFNCLLNNHIYYQTKSKWGYWNNYVVCELLVKYKYFVWEKG